MKKPAYRPDIDALRGIAVLLVVMFHAFPQWVPGGFIGVDVFFVISGYLITSIMLMSVQAGDFSLLEFYRRRIRRIFPSLLVVLSFTWLVGWLVMFPDELTLLGRHIRDASAFILNFTFIKELGYFDVSSHYKPLLHFWSLSIEEQYYLFWPIVLLAFLKFSRRPVVFFGAILFLSLAACLYFTPEYPRATYFNTATRFWQLAAGSLLAAVMIDRNIPSRNWLYFLGLAVILAASFLINSETTYPGAAAMAPVFGAVLIVLSNPRVQRFGGLVHVGLISYPLYLWHWVLISFLFIYLGRQPELLVLAGAIILSILLAEFTYRYVERLRYLRRSAKYQVLGLVIGGAAGQWVINDQGMPGRSQIAYYVNSSYQFTRTPSTDAACLNYVKPRINGERAFYYCRAENLNLPRWIAVVGDSHAHAWFPGVAEVAARHGYGTLLLANSSCPILDGFAYGKTEKETKNCGRSINQILSILKNEPRIKKAAMTSRGPDYINGEVKGRFTTESVEASLHSKGRFPHATYANYFEGFRNTMRQLQAVGHIHKVFYLIENPELDFQPKEVIPRPFDWFGISTNGNTVSRKLYLLRMHIYREGLPYHEFPKLTFLDPVDFFCSGDTCYSFKDGNFLYADGDHFSVFGSKLLTRFFEKTIFGTGNDDQAENVKNDGNIH